MKYELNLKNKAKELEIEEIEMISMGTNKLFLVKWISCNV